MSGLRVEFHPGWLLSRRPYRETSELLEVLTREHGRVGLVARGSRGPKSRQRGVLAPFRPLLLSWLERGELGSLTAVESAGPDAQLEGERMFHGWYLNELLLRLLPRHDPHPPLYDDYAEALGALAGTALEAEAALRIFEKRLLEQLGYGLALDIDLAADARYDYTPDRGLRAKAGAEPGGISGASLIALRDETLQTRAERDDARRLLAAALEPHVPRDSLKTPRLLREMRALRRQ